MLESWHGILHGLGIAFLPASLLYTLTGVFIGTMISHLPGIGPSAGIALLLPVTFGMEPTVALMMLAGIYYGCMYGGGGAGSLITKPRGAPRAARGGAGF